MYVDKKNDRQNIAGKLSAIRRVSLFLSPIFLSTSAKRDEKKREVVGSGKLPDYENQQILLQAFATAIK